MQITKEYLEKKLADLGNQKDQHLANANAAGGAIQVIQQQLEHLNTPEPAANEGS